jgi:hypothetical protein
MTLAILLQEDPSFLPYFVMDPGGAASCWER